MQDETKLVTSGRHPADHIGAVNPPIFRASTILHPDLETLRNHTQPYSYGRRGTPTTRAMEEAMTELEGGAGTVLTPSGLSAVTTAILSFVASGDHLLMTDSCYGPTRIFCGSLLKRLGVETTCYDPLIGGGIEKLIRPNTRLIFLESPGSLTFEVQDLPAIADVAKRHNITTVIDNTWATPIGLKPLSHGIDVSLHAATKYIVGHSDALFGTITANENAYARVLDTHGRLGLCVGADDAYLAQRGLRTLAPRLARHRETAEHLITWLRTRPEVRRVLFPALADDPGHALWKRDFLGASGLFGVELVPSPAKALSAFFSDLKLFGIGWSWGGYESLVVPADPLRTASSHKAGGPLIRISAGFESPGDLIADLEAALARFTAAR